MKEPKSENHKTKEEGHTFKKALSYESFRALFTPVEFNAIISHPPGLDWLLRIVASPTIDLLDPLIVDNLPHVSGNVLTQVRREQILAGEPPPATT